MADSLASSGAKVLPCPRQTRSPLSWIKRRARCIAQFYQIERREAVQNAALDWSAFNPTATH